MADIYSNATGVVVWLGPELYDSSIAMDCIQDIARKLRVDWGTRTMHLVLAEVEKHWNDGTESLPFSGAQFGALRNLFRRGWFERLWIWQEVCLPLPNAILVMCGARIVAWESFCTTVLCLYVNPFVTPELYMKFQQTEQLPMIAQLCARYERQNLPTMIETTRFSKCLDARDKIFAWLSIVREEDKHLGIEPDYSKDLLEVYRDVVVRYIERIQSLEILNASEASRGLSWMPDWSVIRMTRPLEHTFA